MRRGVAFAVTLLTVALRAIFQIQFFTGLALPFGPDVRSRRPSQLRRRTTQRGDQHGNPGSRDETRGHFPATSSFARGFWSVKS